MDALHPKVMPVPHSGCWIWMGQLDKDGYGRRVHSRTGGRAHRTFFEDYVGPVPDDLCVLHKCDIRSCVNPMHLFLGTRTDNAADKVAKGRQRGGPPKLTPQQVADIRLDNRAETVIAAEYGLSRAGVGKIRRHETYKRV